MGLALRRDCLYCLNWWCGPAVAGKCKKLGKVRKWAQSSNSKKGNKWECYSVDPATTIYTFYVSKGWSVHWKLHKWDMGNCFFAMLWFWPTWSNFNVRHLRWSCWGLANIMCIKNASKSQCDWLKTFEGVLARYWSDTWPNKVILSVLKEVEGFRVVRGALWHIMTEQ